MPDATPSPREYAALNAVHAGILAGAALIGRRRHAEPPTVLELGELALATFSISKAVTREKIGAWIREPLVQEEPVVDGHDRAEQMRVALGELVTCSRCLGAWAALSLVGLRVASPGAGRVVTSVFATAGANDFLQAGFALLRERSNLAQRQAEASRRP